MYYRRKDDPNWMPSTAPVITYDDRQVWIGRIRTLAIVKLGGRRSVITDKMAKIGEALICLMGEDGSCYPSKETIVEKAGGKTACSVSSVERTLTRLRDLGFLRWHQQFAKIRVPGCPYEWETKQISNSYEFLVPEHPNIILPAILEQKSRAPQQLEGQTYKIIYPLSPIGSPPADPPEEPEAGVEAGVEGRQEDAQGEEEMAGASPPAPVQRRPQAPKGPYATPGLNLLAEAQRRMERRLIEQRQAKAARWMAGMPVALPASIPRVVQQE